MYGGGGEDGRDGYRDGLNWCEDNGSNITLGTDTNAPLAYNTGLEHHHTIMSTIGDPRGRLEREREGVDGIFPFYPEGFLV